MGTPTAALNKVLTDSSKNIVIVMIWCTTARPTGHPGGVRSFKNKFHDIMYL